MRIGGNKETAFAWLQAHSNSNCNKKVGTELSAAILANYLKFSQWHPLQSLLYAKVLSFSFHLPLPQPCSTMFFRYNLTKALKSLTYDPLSETAAFSPWQAFINVKMKLYLRRESCIVRTQSVVRMPLSSPVLTGREEPALNLTTILLKQWSDSKTVHWSQRGVKDLYFSSV